MRHVTVLLLAALLAACSAVSTPSSDDPPAADPRLVIVEGEPCDAGITVAEALGHGPTDDIVAVTGAVFVDPDGTVRLCDAVLESFPPQCGGAWLLVDGLDLTSLELEEANGLRWAEGVTLLGSVE